jgi:hypothetical protein
VVAGLISSGSEASAPFNSFVTSGAREEIFLELELLRLAPFSNFRCGFSRLAFAGACFGRFALAGFFGDNRAPPRACFLG